MQSWQGLACSCKSNKVRSRNQMSQYMLYKCWGFFFILDTASSHTPVTRRERPRRNSERPRTNSTLAASVGLPCPFSPSGTQDVGSTDWHASERLNLANLDAITFPGITQTSAGESVDPAGQSKPSGQGPSDGGELDDAAKDTYRVRAFSLETKRSERHSPVVPTPTASFQPVSPTNRNDSQSTAPSPSLSPHRATHQHLSSLRISESSLFSPIEQRQPLETGPSLEDYDEVFLQNPPPPSPPSPVKETSIMEDLPLPPPPPPLTEDQEAGPQTVDRLVIWHTNL